MPSELKYWILHQTHIASLENCSSSKLSFAYTYYIILNRVINNLSHLGKNRIKGEVKAENQDKDYKQTAISEEM